MRIIDTPFEGLFIVQPTIFDDNRGSFSEVYNEREFAAKGIHVSFVQDNQSVSRKGVVRGLHFQKPPHAQAKLVRVVQGTALDVAVDLRKESQTYRQHYVSFCQRIIILRFIPEVAHLCSTEGMPFCIINVLTSIINQQRNYPLMTTTKN